MNLDTATHHQIRGFRRGLAVGSGNRSLRIYIVAWAFLITGLLCFAAGAGFLWASAELYAGMRSGEPITKEVIEKNAAWNLIHKSDVQSKPKRR
jgi:hypothetical protein